MNRPRVLAVLALSVAFIGTIVLIASLASGGGDSSGGDTARPVVIGDPLTEALRYVPRSAPAVAVVDTGTSGGPLRQALDLLAQLPGADDLSEQLDKLVVDRTGLSLTNDLGALAGAPLVLATTRSSARTPALAAWVVPDAATLAEVLSARVTDGLLQDAGPAGRAEVFTRVDGKGAYAQAGRLLLAATDRPTLAAALSRGVRRGESAARGLTPEAFASGAASGVSARQAFVRIALDGDELRRLVGTRLPGAGQLPWLAAVTGAGIGVRAGDDGLHARIRIRTDESSLAESDLPLAPGNRAPEVDGEAESRIGLRSPAQTAGFALRSIRLVAPERIQTLDQVLDAVGKATKVDAENDILATLTGPATITFPGGSTVTLRAQTSDEEGVRDALQKLARLGRLENAGDVPSTDYDLSGIAIQDAGDDTYKLTRDEEPIAVVGLRGDVLVASTDALTDVDEVADALDDGPAETGIKGALRAQAPMDAVATLLTDRLGLPQTTADLLGGFGTATVTARAELGSLTVALDLPLAG